MAQPAGSLLLQLLRCHLGQQSAVMTMQGVTTAILAVQQELAGLRRSGCSSLANALIPLLLAVRLLFKRAQQSPHQCRRLADKCICCRSSCIRPSAPAAAACTSKTCDNDEHRRKIVCFDGRQAAICAGQLM